MNYSAPETEQNKMTAESDVWSNGVIIIEMITGIHPFQGLTQNQTLSNIANGKYKPFPDYIQVPPSLNPNMIVGMIPDEERAYQEGLEIIRKNNWGDSTVAFNPVIQSGIVRFGGFFEDPSNYSYFSIGIAESSAVLGSNQYPNSDKNEKKTVCYWRGGNISHNGYEIPGNSRIELNKSVS
ncbi:MAG: hypothetical protein EZS28_001976 [Streblomastix strix]|uniref:Protein kinase domain-containing protein n=1 Tax=Streblomastix strix TaxID=222440 RepID=A0A5J4X793_9EUKA|nr:MAG: hypothetical protein EZS28_001976 [Streblomastix strix]